MRLGSIYLITCLCTEKNYIGQTVQHPPIKRWLDHYQAFNYEDNKDLYLYRAIRRFGIENFSFRILEMNIPLEKLNEREIYYINKYKSNDSEYGYNMTKGGHLTVASKITEEIAKEIIKTIKKEEEKTFVEIAKIYGTSKESISDINCGDTWYFSDEEYPIRNNDKWRGALEKDDVLEIYKLLREGTSLTDIAKKYGVSITNISNINKGLIHKYLNEKEYPIYKLVNASKRLSLDTVKKVIYKLKMTNDVYSKIADELGIGRKTVSAINNGTLYKNKIEELGIKEFPIR